MDSGLENVAGAGQPGTAGGAAGQPTGQPGGQVAQGGAAGPGGLGGQNQPPDPQEALLGAYLDCTAEASVDAVLDGVSLVQTQLYLADRCNASKIAVLSSVQGEEDRTKLAQSLKQWDMETINAVRDRLVNFKDLFKAFMECSNASVRATLSKDHGPVNDEFIENQINQEISACYDSQMGVLLHPTMGVQSPIGLARKDRVMLIAKDRIMQELYKEIKRDNGNTAPGGNTKGEVVAAR